MIEISLDSSLVTIMNKSQPDETSVAVKKCPSHIRKRVSPRPFLKDIKVIKVYFIAAS